MNYFEITFFCDGRYLTSCFLAADERGAWKLFHEREGYPPSARLTFFKFDLSPEEIEKYQKDEMVIK